MKTAGRYVVLAAILPALIALTGAAWAWGPQSHAQLAHDTAAAAPPAIRALFERYESQLGSAVAEPFQLFGPKGTASSSLEAETARAARLLRRRPQAFKTFKAMVRVAHFAADRAFPCAGQADWSSRADREVMQAAGQGVGYALAIDQQRLDEEPETRSPTAACTKEGLESAYSDAAAEILRAWRAVAKAAGAADTLALPLQVRAPRPRAETLAERARRIKEDRARRGITDTPAVSKGGRRGTFSADEGDETTVNGVPVGGVSNAEAFWRRERQDRLRRLNLAIAEKERAERAVEIACGEETLKTNVCVYSKLQSADIAIVLDQYNRALDEYRLAKSRFEALAEECRRAPKCLPGYIR